MQILITLCARGGSKGIPGKNIIEINGKPLIAYSIDLAKQILLEYDVDIALSTDDESIKKVAGAFGISTTYQRTRELASDTAGKVETIHHLLKYEESTRGKRYDFILDLDISSPLRTKDEVETSFHRISSDNQALSLFSVNPSHRNPYFNMVEQNEEGYFSLVKQKDNLVLSRQTSPKVYDLNASFYWYKRSFFEEEYNSPITPKSLIHIMDHICFDLDTPDDLLYLDFLIKQNKLKGLL